MHLFRFFILRRLYQDRLRSGTTLLGIALGIGVVIAIQLTNRSSVRGFEAAVATMAGRTTLEICGTGIGFDERIFNELTWLREYGMVSPIIEGDVRARTRDGAIEPLRVLGVDMLRDRPLRDYRLSQASSADRLEVADDLLGLLLDPHSVVLTEKYGRRHGIAVGSTVELTAGDRPMSFVVKGLLDHEGPARFLDGSFALMDIASAQVALDRIGYLDRVDVRLGPDADIESTERAIQARLPAGLIVRRPEERGQEVERMLAAFHANLTALSYIALLVGLFLIYNTVSTSVIARREEIGTLRALGVTQRGVLALFLGEAFVLAVLGCLVGLAVGPLMARGAVRLTSTAVRILSIAAVTAPPSLDLAHVMLAFGVGVPLALLAGAIPSLEAARVPPNAAQRGADRLETRFRLTPRYFIAPALLFGAAAWLATLPAVRNLPLFGYGAALAAVFGAAFLVPPVLFAVGRVARHLLTRAFHVEPWLANASLSAAIPRLSISVAALAVSLSLTIAIAIMVASFRETVVYWVEQTFTADLFVGPETRRMSSRRAMLSAEVEAVVAGHPDVAAVDSFRNLDVPYQGRTVVVGAGDFEVATTRGNLLFKTPTNGRASMRAAIGTDSVVVSESFALRYGKVPGDDVTLPTPQGTVPFRIAAVYYDYTNDSGMLVMDRRTFRRHFGELRPATLSVYLRDGADPDAVRAELLARLQDRYSIFVRTNSSLRQEVLRVFDSTFAITYALEVVAIAVAILGVIGTLLTLILERQRELRLLRLIGADRSQVRRMVMIEAAMIGGVSQTIGLAVGFVLSLILIYVINLQSFGWTILFRVPTGFLLQSSGLIVITTALAGLYPAHRAATLQTGGAEVE